MRLLQEASWVPYWIPHFVVQTLTTTMEIIVRLVVVANIVTVESLLESLLIVESLVIVKSLVIVESLVVVRLVIVESLVQDLYWNQNCQGWSAAQRGSTVKNEILHLRYFQSMEYYSLYLCMAYPATICKIQRYWGRSVLIFRETFLTHLLFFWCL